MIKSRQTFTCLCFAWLVAGLASCSREPPVADSRPAGTGGAIGKSAVPRQPVAIPGNVPPPTFLFVGETWVGKTGYFAIRDPVSTTSAWHRVGDKIGLYEIVGTGDGMLVVRAGDHEFSVLLRGLESHAENGTPPNDPKATATSAAPIKVWSNGMAVEAAPDRMPADFLKAYNDSKEALLNAKVSPDLEPMVAQALESNTVILGTAEDGFKRSDFPADISAKLSDDTLAKINAMIKADKDAASRK